MAGASENFYGVSIENCQIYDSRTKKRQTYAISFEGSFAQPVEKLRIISSRLSGEGGASVGVAAGIDISSVEIIYPIDWSLGGNFPGKVVMPS